MHWPTVHTPVHTHRLPLIQVQVVQPVHGARISSLPYATPFLWTTMQVQVLPISFKAMEWQRVQWTSTHIVLDPIGVLLQMLQV